MNALHTLIALGPIAGYFLLLGILNRSRHPFLTTGTRDLYALGVALVGMATIGPLELFFPDHAVLAWSRFRWSEIVLSGPMVWLMLIVFYALCVTLLVLLARPRWVIYNVTVDQLRPVLARVVSQLDSDHQWAGESLAMPTLGIQLRLESHVALRNVTLVAVGTSQSQRGWRRFEEALSEELRAVTVAPNPIGLPMVGMSLLVLVGMVAWVVAERQEVAQGLMTLLRL